MKNIKTIILLLLITISLEIFAQGTYKIHGKVMDDETGEGLIGASIMVLNSDPLIGTVTDFDGNYNLSNIPVNLQKIKLSYVSYETNIIEGISSEKGIIKMDVVMKSRSFEMEEIIVKAKAITNTETAISALQKKSLGMINGISSQQISRFGDSDIASSIKRVSGVSITDGKYVFVRGLSDRYSQVSLNGAVIPGLDPNKNTVQMDIFPTSIIDNIIVHKSFTSDLPASFTGGYVNIITKSYPEDFTLHLSTSFGYNPQTHLNTNFLSYEGGRYDAFGVDDGSRQIPKIAQGEVPARYENDELLGDITKSFSNNMKSKKKEVFLNQSQSFAIGNKISLGGKDFGFIFSGNYRRSFKNYDNGIIGEYTLLGDTEEGGIMNAKNSQRKHRGEENTMMSFLAGMSYKFNPFHSINFLFLRNSSGLNTAEYREGYKSDDNLYWYGHTLGFLERSFSSAQLSGNHVFENLGKIKVNWITSFTDSKQDEPDLRIFNYSGKEGSYEIKESAYSVPVRFFRELNERNIDNKLNIDIPVKLFNRKIVFKTGGGFTHKARTSVSRKFNIKAKNVVFDGDIERYLSDENSWKRVGASLSGLFVENDSETDLINSYTANESIIAAYGLIDISLTSKLKMLTGFRYAYNYLSVGNMIAHTDEKYKGSQNTLTDIYPMFNLKYEITDNMNMRFSYGNTVARPAFREIAPYAYYDYVEGITFVGDPNLRATAIDNVDLRWERFGQKGDLVSFSIFYKYFENAIEVVDAPQAPNPELHFINVNESELYGFEVEVKKHLNEINLPNLMIGSNFTLLHSEVEYISDVEDNTTSRRPMYGQAPMVFNTYISYADNISGWSSTLSFNIEGEKLAVVTKGKAPNVFKQSYPDLKFNVSKVFAERFKVKAGIGNILDQEYQNVYHYSGKDYIYRSYQLGRTYSLSISYDIN